MLNKASEWTAWFRAYWQGKTDELNKQAYQMQT